MDGATHTMSDGTSVTYPNGGPYYYRLKTGVTAWVAAQCDNSAKFAATSWNSVLSSTISTLPTGSCKVMLVSVRYFARPDIEFGNSDIANEAI
jgi:hypothetical protein